MEKINNKINSQEITKQEISGLQPATETLSSTIDIAITDFEDFYSPYSMEGSEVINSELKEYILSNTIFEKINTSLEINVHTKNVLTDKKRLISKIP